MAAAKHYDSGKVVEQAVDTATTQTKRHRRYCGAFNFNGNPDATGYNYNCIATGYLIIANLMLNQSLLWLASNAAGCFEDTDGDNEPGACTKRIYGMLPSTYVANIATFSGVGAAILMPIAGAYVDFTPHRRALGIGTASIMTLIQFIQVFTIQKTWLAMSILQMGAAVLFQIQNMVVYAYEPEFARDVGEESMGRFTAHFISNQFGAQIVFLVLIAAIQAAMGEATNAVVTGQISQAINTLTCIVFYGLCWFKYMTPRPALRELPPNTNIVKAGLRQNWETIQNMNRYFKRGLRWYFLAVIFARAASNSLTQLSVIYLQDTLKLGPMGIVVFFLCSMVGVVPGPHLGLYFTRRSDPVVSYKWSNLFLFVVLIMGVFILEYIPRYCAYIWGFVLGVALGWFFSTENLFYSMALPKGQAAELSGFFVCSTQLLVWLPPLLFVLVIENNIAQKYGWLPVASFTLAAAGLLGMAGSWDEIVEEATQGFEAIEAANTDKDDDGETA